MPFFFSPGYGPQFVHAELDLYTIHLCLLCHYIAKHFVSLSSFAYKVVRKW